MSETVRSFTGSDNAPRFRGHRARRGIVRNVVLAIVIAVAFYSCYATRDSAPMERFIPANNAFSGVSSPPERPRKMAPWRLHATISIRPPLKRSSNRAVANAAAPAPKKTNHLSSW